MKDQYFGDINDFRKYGLLRVLRGAFNRLGVCWMLTPPDDRKDGGKVSYLEQPERHRSHDPELFDWLREVVAGHKTRSTSRIEDAGLLGDAVFQSRLLADRRDARREYFHETAARVADCDLVFFNPDTGLEVSSKPFGLKDSSKYLYWSEVVSAFSAGSSVLIYQHFPRRKRAAYIAEVCGTLQARTSSASVFAFRTPHVLFLLATHEEHVGPVHACVAALGASWPASELRCVQYP